MSRVLAGLLMAVALAVPADAQNFAPRPPARPLMPGGPVATICSTAWGWCPVQGVLPAGGACLCFVPPSTRLPGVARYFPYQGPVSPHLNPHTTPPSTLR